MQPWFWFSSEAATAYENTQQGWVRSDCLAVLHCVHVPYIPALERQCPLLSRHFAMFSRRLQLYLLWKEKKADRMTQQQDILSVLAHSISDTVINNFWVKTLHACSSWSIRYVIPNYIIYWMFFPYFLSRICVQCTWMCWNLWQIFKTCYTCEKSWYEIFYSGAHQLFRLRFIPNRWKKKFSN